MAGPATTPQRQSETDDRSLVERLRADDEAAYEEMVRRFGPRMLAVARRLLSNEDDSLDALQDAFLSAFKAIDSFNAASSLATWLHRIVVNASLMRLRRRMRKPETSIDDLLPKYNEEGHRLTGGDWRITYDKAVEVGEIRDTVLQAIDRLPETHREVLLLRDIEELSTEEVAQQLEINEGAVKTRLHRARSALREMLDPYMRENSQ